MSRLKGSRPVVSRTEQDRIFSSGIQHHPEDDVEAPVDEHVKRYQEKSLNFQDPNANYGNQPPDGQGEPFYANDVYEPQFRVYNTLVDTYNALLVNGSEEDIDAAEAALDAMKPPDELSLVSSQYTPDQIRGHSTRLHLGNSLVGYTPQAASAHAQGSFHTIKPRAAGSYTRKDQPSPETDHDFVTLLGGKYRSKGRYHKSKKIYHKNKRSMKRKNSKRRSSMKRGKR